MNKKKIIYLLIIILLLVIAFAGILYIKKMTDNVAKLKYYQGWEEAKKLYAKVCVPATVDQASEKISNFYGKIKEVKADSIIVEANPIGLYSKGKKTMSVKIGENTQIKQIVLKDESEYNQELKLYQAKIGATSQELNPTEPPPSKFKQIKVDINSLKVDQGVTVTAGSNITEKTNEVIASEILIDYVRTIN